MAEYSVGLYDCTCWQIRDLKVGVWNVDIADNTVKAAQGLDQQDTLFSGWF